MIARSAATMGQGVEETSIKLDGDFSCAYGAALQGGLMSALALRSNLPEDILKLVGMSGRLYRRFVNEVVARTNNARYLEVGSWAGSTASAAMYGNKLRLTCVDNWSLFSNHMGIGSPYEGFISATNQASSEHTELTVIENDFRQVDYGAIGRFNVYLFDGPHEYQDQYDGVKMAQPALEDRYIQIVDDWNWPDVRQGTFDALKSVGKIVCSVEIRTTQDDSHPQKATNQDSAWHNGYFLAVIQK